LAQICRRQFPGQRLITREHENITKEELLLAHTEKGQLLSGAEASVRQYQDLWMLSVK